MKIAKLLMLATIFGCKVRNDQSMLSSPTMKLSSDKVRSYFDSDKSPRKVFFLRRQELALAEANLEDDSQKKDVLTAIGVGAGVIGSLVLTGVFVKAKLSKDSPAPGSSSLKTITDEAIPRSSGLAKVDVTFSRESGSDIQATYSGSIDGKVLVKKGDFFEAVDPGGILKKLGPRENAWVVMERSHKLASSDIFVSDGLYFTKEASQGQYALYSVTARSNSSLILQAKALPQIPVSKGSRGSDASNALLRQADQLIRQGKFDQVIKFSGHAHGAGNLGKIEGNPFEIIRFIDNYRYKDSRGARRYFDAVNSLHVLKQDDEVKRMGSPTQFTARYKQGYEPASKMDQGFLGDYLKPDSAQFLANKESVTVFHSHQTPMDVARRVMLKRETVNIGGSKKGGVDEDRVSHFNSYASEPETAPGPVGVYARSQMQLPDGAQIQVGTMHVPGLAFDSLDQVHMKKYTDSHGNLRLMDKGRIRGEYQEIAKMVVEGYLLHAKSGKANGRMLIGAYGSASFVTALKDSDKVFVRTVIAETLVDELVKRSQDLKAAGVTDVRLNILLSKFDKSNIDQKTINSLEARLSKEGLQNRGGWGKIPNDAVEGDYNVNAWDPNSNIGNGNALDQSLDGFHGRSSTAAYDIHTSANLLDPSKYRVLD